MGATVHPCQFVIGTRGLNTSIDDFYWEEDWQNADDLPPNTTWEHVTVRRPSDVDKWLDAKNRWLSAAWTPNQSPDERDENAVVMQEQMNIMASLEIR